MEGNHPSLIIGDTNRLSCEPRGIPEKGLQIACLVAIYVNDVICKLALRLRTGEENNSKVPVLFDLMMALRSRETHSITMKNMALFRPKLSDFFSTNQIARFGQEQCC